MPGEKENMVCLGIYLKAANYCDKNNCDKKFLRKKVLRFNEGCAVNNCDRKLLRQENAAILPQSQYFLVAVICCNKNT